MPKIIDHKANGNDFLDNLFIDPRKSVDIKMASAAVNGSVVDAVASQCEINLTNYNYSLFRASLAACNKFNRQRTAQALVVGFAVRRSGSVGNWLRSWSFDFRTGGRRICGMFYPYSDLPCSVYDVL